MLKSLHWLNALFGAWFIVAPWALDFSDHKSALWASVVVGAIQLIVAIWVAVSENVSGWNIWQSWITLLTGIWFVLQPYFLHLTSTERWLSTVVGAITIIFSLLAMGAGKKS